MLLLHREITQRDILLPEDGRAMAKQLGAKYYETSAFESFGIDTLFLNASRVALIAKRNRFFWHSFGILKHILTPTPQEPHLSPKPLPPKQKRSFFPKSEHDYSRLLSGGYDELYDVVFVVGGVEIKAHKLFLVITSRIFARLFCRGGDSNIFDLARIEVDNPNRVTGAIKVKVSSALADSNSTFNSESIFRFIYTGPIFSRIETRVVEVEANEILRTFVTVSESISASVWATLMHYLYSGKCPRSSRFTKKFWREFKRLAVALQLNSLLAIITKLYTGLECIKMDTGTRAKHIIDGSKETSVKDDAGRPTKNVIDVSERASVKKNGEAMFNRLREQRFLNLILHQSAFTGVF